MNVPIIENWSEVRGRITAAHETTVTNHVAVTVSIDSVEPVEGYPNLLHKRPGDELTLLVRKSFVDVNRLLPGALFSGYVRRAGPDRFYVNPKHFTIVS